MALERSIVMLQRGISKLFQNELETLLAPLSSNSGFYDLVREPLFKVWHDSGVENDYGHIWLYLPLIVCDAICGSYEHALPASVGLELLKAAAEVFDDIEDADSTESLSVKYGTSLAINVASALLILAERAFTRLRNRGVDNEIVLSLIDTVNSYYATACTGQYLDMSITPEEAFSEDVYLKVIEIKSAFAVRCACYTGALLATSNKKIIHSFTIFGHNLGMASQIANDIKGITNLKDISRRKITLPAIYALAQTNGEIHQLLATVFCKSSNEFVSPPVQIRDLLFSTGAIQYATIKMEFYKQQAANILIELEQLDVKVNQLQQFLN